MSFIDHCKVKDWLMLLPMALRKCLSLTKENKKKEEINFSLN